MRLSHAPAEVSAVFDDPNLVSCAGLAPVFALGQRCGFAWLVADKLTVANTGGVNAAVKVPALVAGTVAGADWFYNRYFPYYGDFARLDGNDNDGRVCESCRSSNSYASRRPIRTRTGGWREESPT